MLAIRSSIRNKLTILLLASTIVPIVTSIVFSYQNTKESLKNETVEANNRLIAEGGLNVVYYLTTLKNASFGVYTNTTLDGILGQGLQDYRSESHIFTLMQLVFRSMQDIHQVYLGVPSSNRSYLIGSTSFSRAPLDYAFPESVTPYGVYVEGTHPSGTYGIAQRSASPEVPVFTLHRPIYRVPSTELIGWLAVDVRLSGLERLVSQLYQEGKEELYMLDRSGTVVFATDESAYGRPLQENWVSEIVRSPDASGSLEWTSSPSPGILIYSKVADDDFGWTLVKKIPYAVLYEDARKTAIANAVVAAVFLSIATAAIIVVSFQLTKPIKRLLQHISKIQTGKLDEPIDIRRSDEIGTLASRFQSMMNTINDMIIREYQLNLSNKTTELKMLQAQINPHFLNNSLQSIGHLALQSNARDVYALISSLGQMMHYSMNTEESFVPLEKELDYVAHYCALQLQRFDEKLEIDWRIDPASKAVPVPKMIVQPIVENFFTHGMMGTVPKQAAKLLIASAVASGELVVTVEDNGCGIPEERLERLRQRLDAPEYAGMQEDSIGLQNVLTRIRLYYGEQAGLRLANVRPQGLRVDIVIPMAEAGKEETA